MVINGSLLGNIQKTLKMLVSSNIKLTFGRKKVLILRSVSLQKLLELCKQSQKCFMEVKFGTVPKNTAREYTGQHFVFFDQHCLFVVKKVLRSVIFIFRNF